MNSCKIGGSVVVLYFFLLLFICVHANEAHIVLPKEDIYFYLLFNVYARWLCIFFSSNVSIHQRGITVVDFYLT